MEFQDSRNEYFMKLYEPHHASALAYAMRLAGNEDDARDLLHDSLEASLRAFGTLRRAESFKPWFFRIMRNRSINRARRLKLSRRFSFRVAPGDGLEVDEQAAERAKLKDALDMLSPEEREAVILFEVEGFHIRDIARIQHRSIQAIKYRLRRGRDKLRRAYFSDIPPPSARTVPAQDK
jgi:RNA polymerase sigma-70 factor (ECF subfamily)